MSSTQPSQKDILRMQSLYGENKTITGDYNVEHSVNCENGTFVGKCNDGVLSFKGIPFAKPPINELRWKAPQPVEQSNEIKEAYYFGKSPIQQPWYSELASCYPQSEDCLYLNVWADKDKSVKKPVMVFIHGGAYGYGGTSDPLYDGQNFIKAHSDVILVTIAYRVGVMGFIDFSMVEGGEGYEDSCNLGLLDQIEALKWIQRNIAAFGGDPKNVTIFGESAGGGSVSILAVMDMAKGLFNRIIAESGSICLTYSKKEFQPFTQKFMKKAKAKNMKDLLRLSTEEIYKANLPINESNNFPMRDGRIVPFDLYKAYKDGKSKDIDMMSGTNKDECRYWIGELGGIFKYSFAIPALFENQCKIMSPEDRALASQYYKHGTGKTYMRLTEFENDITFRVPAQEQLLLHADNGGKAYHYFWTYPSSIKYRGACHAVELSSVFNNLDEKIFTGDNVNPQLAREVQQMWVNFAKTGNPSTENHSWSLYNRDTKETMVLGEEIFVKKNLLSRRTATVEKLLKYYINGNYVKLDYDISYVRFYIYMALIVIIICIILGYLL